MCTCPNYMIYEGIYSNRYSANGKHLLWKFIGHHQFKDIIKDRNYDHTSYVEVPCGKCIECRLQITRSWADRCVLESKAHPNNFFITLTYNDDAVKATGESLDYSDLSRFIKRVRKRFCKYDENGKIIDDTKIKYFAVGEYGEKSLRKHFHIIFFNLPLNDLSLVFEEFKDGRYQKYNRQIAGLSDRQFYSRTIYDLWKDKKLGHLGYISVAPFSFDTAAYISQYVCKKITGDMVDPYISLGWEPEKLRMSRGIGGNMFDKDEFELQDSIIVSCSGEAHVSKFPRYFEKLYEKRYGDLPIEKLSSIAEKRKDRFNTILYDNIDVDYQNEVKDAVALSRQKNNRKL